MPEFLASINALFRLALAPFENNVDPFLADLDLSSREVLQTFLPCAFGS